VSWDGAIVGGGIVGLATAYQLLQRRPDLRLAVLEKEDDVGRHQSGNNSGVVHAGIYYAPGSLKARLCREGKAALESFAAAHDIPIERCGKVIIAVDRSELGRLDDLEARSRANGVPDVELIGPERLRELEPHAVGLRALWSPDTGIVDYARVTHAFADEVRARGGVILTGRRVDGIRERGAEQVVHAPRGDIAARWVITCAGLHSDRVAAMTDGRDDVRIVPFRGDYYTLRPEVRYYCRSLIYPVPDPAFPFLGVHFTKRVDGEVLAGPNAVLAFAREGYRIGIVSPRDLAATLAFSGFRRLAAANLRTGLAEMWRGISVRAFARALQRYVPAVQAEDLRYGPTGVRAQALRADGQLVDDFLLGGTERVLHVRNAPSPGATASLAIGRVLAERAIERFGL